MKIYTFFGAYRGSDGFECLDAWDEYTRDENEDGYEKDRAKWSENNDLESFAVVVLEVDESAIRKALAPPVVTIPAAVVESASREGVQR